jgi:hypothetical protein
MSAPCKFELSILSHDEKALMQTSHHPEIGDADRATLENLRSSLRKFRDRERTLAFHRRRISKGTAEPRGQSVSGTAEHSLHRKQVFVAALKRVNKELARLQKFEARKQLGEAARRALSLRRAQQFARPTNEPTSHEGMKAIPSRPTKYQTPAVNNWTGVTGKQESTGRKRFPPLTGLIQLELR